MPLFGVAEKLMNTSQDALNCRSSPQNAPIAPRKGRILAKPSGMNRFKEIAQPLRIAFSTIGLFVAVVGCSRETKVYSDPAAPAAVTPVSTDGRAFLPKDFYNQSVNRASVELQPDGVSSTSKALRFQTSLGTNTAGGFNGAGLGNRAVVGIGSWSGRPVNQAEPITFDAKNFAGAESVGANLQIDLACDGATFKVVNANGADIGVQSHVSAGDGYTRFTASTLAAIWLSPTAAILDPDTSAVLVPATGTPVSLSALLAVDLAKGVPTAAILLSLGSDSTTTNNSTFVRRLTIGSEIFEGLE